MLTPLTVWYRSGRTKNWIKAKNPDSSAMTRVGAVTARRFPALWSVRELEQAFRIEAPMGRRSPTRISGETRTRLGRRMCSRTTRPGGSQPTSPSCRSCCPGRARSDLPPAWHGRRRWSEMQPAKIGKRSPASVSRQGPGHSLRGIGFSVSSARPPAPCRRGVCRAEPCR
jgi:hypothetical protein